MSNKCIAIFTAALLGCAIGSNSNAEDGLLSGMTVKWKKQVANLTKNSVIRKPQCNGGIELKLINPKFANESVTGHLSVDESPDGLFWVITEARSIVRSSNYQTLTNATLSFRHHTGASMICYTKKLPTVEWKDGKVLVTPAG